MPPASKQSLSYWTWTTAWGPIGAVASTAGVSRVVLPHYQMKDLDELLAWEHQGAVRDEAPFQAMIELSRDYFNRSVVDFSEIDCELPAETKFYGKVWRACRAIPYGQSVSYGRLALQIGQPDAARAVATALGKNPIPLLVPCHRVTYSDGRCGGFSAPGGEQLKQRLLELEKR